VLPPPTKGCNKRKQQQRGRERERSSRVQRFGATEVKEDGSETVEKNPRNPHQQQRQQHQMTKKTTTTTTTTKAANHETGKTVI
jgi:hypothetical protein